MEETAHQSYLSRRQCVYAVDEHPADLRLIQKLCDTLGIQALVYQCPQQFLEDISATATGCLIVDLLFPDMNGLDLFAEVNRRNIQLTTVVMTGFADANSCRTGFRAGVFDFVEKDLGAEEILSVIRRALDHNRQEVVLRHRQETRWKRIEGLTARELDVAKLLSTGSVLKEIGSKLRITVQTASKHRTSIFEKLDVKNEVELYQAFSECLSLLEQATRPTHHRYRTCLPPQRIAGRRAFPRRESAGYPGTSRELGN